MLGNKKSQVRAGSDAWEGVWSMNLVVMAMRWVDGWCAVETGGII